MRVLAYLLLAIVPACADESISGYADPTAVYRLSEIDGAPFTARATITFPEAGAARGDGPCNAWSAVQSAPYPWLELGPIATTRRGCPELSAEQQFFVALTDMTLAEVQGPVLILSNDDGREMLFRADL